MTRRRALAALVVLALALVAPAGAHATLTGDMLGFYDADRQANGLPPVSTVNAAMEQGCANHDRYMALNHEMVHGEDPSRPGYTPQGNYQDGAQGGEVLAEDHGWTATYEPWATAPIHLYLLFDPSVAQVGYADLYGFQCVRMRGADAPVDDSSPAPPVFYAWTSDTGRRRVPPAERAAEYPYTPQQLVGIPASQTTGPNILLFSAQDAGTPVSATLAGPSGAVQTALVNASTKNAVGDGGWFTGGGVLVPVRPLRPLTTYDATVTWQDGGSETQQFSFTTGPRIVFTTITLTIRSDRRARTRFFVRGTPHPALTLTRRGFAPRHPRVRHGRTAWVRLPLGLWNVCASSADPTHPARPVCASFIVDVPAARQ